MAFKPLTEAQRQTIKSLSPTELFSQHPNGDITIFSWKGKEEERIRINSLGVIVQRTTDSGAGTERHYQPSLSDELTGALHAQVKAKLPAPDKKPKVNAAYSPNPKVAYGTTICQERPECCKPRSIKAVFLDADHTIWHMPVTAAAVTGPLKKLDDNTVVELGSSGWGKPTHKRLTEQDLLPEERVLIEGLDSAEKDYLLEELTREHYPELMQQEGAETHRTTIKLDPTLRPLLDELDKRQIPAFIISLNTPGSVSRILKEFGLDNRFMEIKDSYENKGSVFKKLTHKTGVCPCDGLFVDDNRANVQDVDEEGGLSLQIGEGKDIPVIYRLLNFIKD